MSGLDDTHYLERSALVTHVVEALHSEGVVGLVAPGGYGKTVLAEAVCAQVGCPLVRVVCAPDRIGAAVFFDALRTAGQSVFTGEEQAAMPDTVEALLGALVDGAPQGSLWWVDEVHLLYGTPAFALLVEFARRMRHQRGGRLLWAARFPAPGGECGLSRLSAWVGEARLALNLAEVMRFFAGQVSGGEAAVLLELSGGWFPALQAVARRLALGDTRVLAGDVQALAVDLRGIFQDRVFGALRPSVLRLLRTLAELPSCPLDILPVLAAEGDDARVPLRLAERGCFLAIDGDSLVFKPLLRAVLRAMSEAGGMERSGEASVRAARWFEMRGEVLHALHCLDARVETERAEAEALLGRCHAVLLGQGEAVALWLRALTVTQLRFCPWLALAAGSFAQGARPAGEAAILLGYAAACFAERNERLGLLRTELARVRRGLFGEPGYPPPDALMVLIRALMADPAVGNREGERVLAALAEGQYQILHGFSHARLRQAVWPLLSEGVVVGLPWARAELVAILAHGESMIGHARRALDVLEQAHDSLSQPLPPWTRVYLRMARANVLGLLGRVAAFEHARLAILREPESVVRQSLAGPFLDIWRLTGLMTMGRADEAVALAESCLHDVRVAAVPALRGEFLHYLGYAHALRGNVNAAQNAIVASREAEHVGGNDFFLWVNTLVAGATAVLCSQHAEGRRALEAVKGQTRVEGELALREASEWLLALSCLRCGDEKGMETALRVALVLNRERDGHVFLWSRLWIPELLARAVACGIEPQQARRVARRVFAADITEDGTWIPVLELRCFGGLCLRVEGQEPLSGEALTPVQQRLLGALARAPEHTLGVADLLYQLWPGVSSESARGSLDTALLRLRRVLAGHFGREVATRHLVLHNTRLSLRHAEVDWQWIPARLHEALALDESGHPWQAEELLAQCFDALREPLDADFLADVVASGDGVLWRTLLEQAFSLWSRLLHGHGRAAERDGAALRLHAVFPADSALTLNLYRHLRRLAEGEAATLERAEQLLRTHERALRESGLPEAVVQNTLVELFGD